MSPQHGAVAALLLMLGTAACTGTSTGTGATPPRSGATPSSCPSYSWSPALARDTVLDMEVRHVRESVVIKLHQEDVVDSQAQIWDFVVNTPTESWSISVFTTRRGTEAWLFESTSLATPAPTPEPNGCGEYLEGSLGLACRGVMGRVSSADDEVDVVIPRRCLGHPKWVQVGVTVSDGDHEPTYSDPALGPRVGVV